MTVQIDLPSYLYESVSKRAEENGTTVAAEVIAAVEVREKDLDARRNWYEESLRIQAEASGLPGPSAEEMLREDRERDSLRS